VAGLLQEKPHLNTAMTRARVCFIFIYFEHNKGIFLVSKLHAGAPKGHPVIINEECGAQALPIYKSTSGVFFNVSKVQNIRTQNTREGPLCFKKVMRPNYQSRIRNRHLQLISTHRINAGLSCPASCFKR